MAALTFLVTLLMVTGCLIISPSSQLDGSRLDRAVRPMPRPASLALAPDDSGGLSPEQVRHAYGIDRLNLDGAGQVIAVITAYDSPSIASDLRAFNDRFGLPSMAGLTPGDSCTIAKGPHPCLERIDLDGDLSDYRDEWALETALNVQWAHAIAPGADILLVAAPTASFDGLVHASDLAIARGAHVVALSWGSVEFPEEQRIDQHFHYPNVVFVAPAGDTGSGVLYPAASPYVVAVGGTTLVFDAHGRVASETAWIGSGGGESSFEQAPPYQVHAEVATPRQGRMIPDVAYVADPRVGFAVYNSRSPYGRNGWFRQGGTSAGVPQWAALFALANQARGNRFLSSTDLNASPLYQIAPRTGPGQAFRDIVEGTNGNCPRCTAGAGYDPITGLGSPRADVLVPALGGLP